MPRKAGTPKTGGRPKGGENKVTKELRLMIKDFAEKRLTSIIRDFDSLPPALKVKLYIDFLQFVLPKLGSTTVDLSLEKMNSDQLDIVVNHLLKKNAEKSKGFDGR